MNLITRLTATLSGKMEDIVSQVENHDAVVAAALQDTRSAVAKARIRLDRVRKDGAGMQKRLEEFARMETVWADRARSSAAQNEAKALECIARRNQCRQQAEQLQQALTRHNDMEHKLHEDVRSMEQRLTTLTQQQNLMRSRQSAAEAMRVISQIEASTSGSAIEDTFDRWEQRITETEYAIGSASDIDSLDVAFVKEENAAQLKAELDALLEQKE